MPEPVNIIVIWIMFGAWCVAMPVTGIMALFANNHRR